MKRIGILSTTIVLFAISLYAAYLQGVGYAEDNGLIGTHLAALEPVQISVIWIGFMDGFSWVLGGLTNLLGGSLMAGVIALALFIELITLYPSVRIQLMQKQIHLFHKKLVDRFTRGELSVSDTKHELDILYSVNERMHRQGTWLIGSQLIVFVLVFVGLYLSTRIPSALPGGYNSFKLAMLSGPVDFSLPLLAGLAYLLHSLVKIHLKQREDYIAPRQVYAALIFGLTSCVLVFYFASVFAVLLTVYFVTLITFTTMRTILVEERAKEWGKAAQRELIHLLRTSSVHKNKWEQWSRKFHHLPTVRYLNFHLLEEAASMSLTLFIALSTMKFM